MQRITYQHIVAVALAEDIGHGDITTTSIFTDETGTGHIITREPGIVAGLPVAREVFFQIDPDLQFTPHVADGDPIQPADRLATISGSISSILQGERVALNFLQRLSAIASTAHAAVTATAGTRARITDTRKTTPGLRVLEKYAVRMGGGENHRFSLSDMVLIKDNHIMAAGSIHQAVTRVRSRVGFTVKIEVEAASLDDVQQALSAGADIIMLDNMSPDLMRPAVQLIAGQALIEASGNITLTNISDVAHTGVDLISLGFLTHSIRALDIALKLN